MNAYRVFTVSSGQVEDGAEIAQFNVSGAGVCIPAILVGEQGRGRELGVLPIGEPIPPRPCPKRGKGAYIGTSSSLPCCDMCGIQYEFREAEPGLTYGRNAYHPVDAGEARDRLMAASIGQTKAGRPKLFGAAEATSDEKIIVVFRTHPGYRGGSIHGGDRTGWKCRQFSCPGAGDLPRPDACPVCGANGDFSGPQILFAPFPGEVLVNGHIAQGAAGRMGGSEQLVALMLKSSVFRTSYSGRLYGGPSSHYYLWDGSRLLVATWKEREASDVF